MLLALIAVGMLSLSTITLRAATQDLALAEARANARLALTLALGELQKEMGPDMRVSAESSLFDKDVQTSSIDGLSQSRWLASYDSWGNWLNAEYTRPGENNSLRIQETYEPQRSNMFRRWLLSLPDDMKEDVDLPLSSLDWSDEDSVVLVGEGSLGDSAIAHPDRVTRARLLEVGETGRQAWWIGAENQKAKFTLAAQARDLAEDAWESAQGGTAEVAVGTLEGFDHLEEEPELSFKLVSQASLDLAGVEREVVKEHFFDLTAHSEGVVASVRTGHLKKDLSLLLESSTMPEPYDFSPSRDTREPSIRPMSSDLEGKNPKIPNRHFASWTNMRHFYRMYRSDSDATVSPGGGGGSLEWTGAKPSTEVVTTNSISRSTVTWDGSNNYWRVPILAKVTFIYSLQSEPSQTRGKYDCYLVYSPIFTFWNPYNVDLEIPDSTLGMLTAAYKILPYEGNFFLGSTLTPSASGNTTFTSTVEDKSYVRSSNGRDIAFKPGEIRLFSHKGLFSSRQDPGLFEGFDPQAIGGTRTLFGSYSASDLPGVSLTFAHSHAGGNVNWGNTPGSLCHSPYWGNDTDKMPTMYQHDWFQVGQTLTPITPDPVLLRGSIASRPDNLAGWVFSDSEPVPFAYAQLVLKGLSEFEYESIEWESDWRSRNWIQAPPFYFGSAQYISEDPTIAHTQRLDNPYVMNFGPMSMAEMPKVVPHLGGLGFLGSGASPYEKVTAVPALALPTAPVGSLAGFSNMRINPGWLKLGEYGSHLIQKEQRPFAAKSSLYSAECKTVAYQSGITGPGIGNSFVHPMIPRQDVYQFFDNSKSQDPKVRTNWSNTETVDNKVFNDYWDHTFLLNDALWDDYFVSSLADQTRPGASAAKSLQENIDSLVEGDSLANSRLLYRPSELAPDDEVKKDFADAEGYLLAAKHLMIDGMFNVNSTSVPAWKALFMGIRERKLIKRENGGLSEVALPQGKEIAISRFNTPTTGQEMDDPETGVARSDGNQAWSGVRFLDDEQLERLAQECVKQVKLRGPFLNLSEFINRRLSNDELGTMGALQSAIDYDDHNPDSNSINYRFKNGPGFMITESDLGQHSFKTPEAAEGSRFAGIPGYVIQSDILKPIGNTLTVRDDTFRIRAYGETLAANGTVVARAWCEAIVQRIPEYVDSSDDPEVAARVLDGNNDFEDNGELSEINRSLGRKFEIRSFRWLQKEDV